MTTTVITTRNGNVFIGELMSIKDGVWTLTNVASVFISDDESSVNKVAIGFRPLATFSSTPWVETVRLQECDILLHHCPVTSMEDAWRSYVTGLDLMHSKTSMVLHA